MIGEPLVVASHQGGVDGCLGAVRPSAVRQHGEDVLVEAVHLVVVVFQGQRGLDVLAGDDRSGLSRDPLGYLTHLLDGGAHRRVDGGVRVAPPGQLGHVLGEVAHAFEVCAHPHRGDHPTQIGSHGLLPGQQVDRAVVELAAQRVDLLVRGDDALSQMQVRFQQCCGRPGHRGAGEPGHFDQLLGDLVKVLVEGFAHGSP